MSDSTVGVMAMEVGYSAKKITSKWLGKIDLSVGRVERIDISQKIS